LASEEKKSPHPTIMKGGDSPPLPEKQGGENIIHSGPERTGKYLIFDFYHGRMVSIREKGGGGGEKKPSIVVRGGSEVEGAFSLIYLEDRERNYLSLTAGKKKGEMMTFLREKKEVKKGDGAELLGRRRPPQFSSL